MDALSNEAWSEQWRLKALECADAEAAALMLEETKSAVFSQMASKLGDIPVNRAEMQVKASVDWTRWIEGMVKARRHANRLRIERDFLRMKFQEWISHDANKRAEMRL